MVLHGQKLPELKLVAAVWLIATASFAAPQSNRTMELGAQAAPPPAYIAFCERQPLDCGSDVAIVLAAARQAEVDRILRLARFTLAAARASTQASAAASPTASDVRLDAADGAPAAILGAPGPPVSAPEMLPGQAHAGFVDPSRPAEDEGALKMTPGLWATLNRVNGNINHAIVMQSDLKTYGVEDYWATPLERGGRYGDCEDFVLEKERALLAAGLPRRALNIAVVTTRLGENHAVLLVATRSGEFVLDNITPWVRLWNETGYLWRERQVNGEPFHWVMIQDPQVVRSPRARSGAARRRGLFAARRRALGGATPSWRRPSGIRRLATACATRL